MQNISFLKILLILGIIGQTISVSHSQCIDYDTLIERKISLDSTYYPIPGKYRQYRHSHGVIFWGDMDRRERSESFLWQKFQKNLTKILDNYSLIHKKINYIESFLYINKNGKIQYSLIHFLNHTLSSYEENLIKEDFCQWASTYKFLPAQQSEYRLYIGESVNPDNIISISGNKPEKQNTLSVLNTDMPDTVKAVKLTKMDLERFPKIIRKFKNIESINFSGNELKKIPRFISKLKKLRYIDISENRLVCKKMKFKRNSNIYSINLQYNKLNNIPKSLFKNKNLRALWIGYNDLSSAKNLHFVDKFTFLEDINLYNANLDKIPDGIVNLSNIKSIDLYHNHIKELPASIGRLQNLEELALGYNYITELPRELNSLSKLRSLYVQSNFLKELPVSLDNLTSLQEINISKNYFEILPKFVLDSHFLKIINVSSNKIKHLPENIPDAIQIEQIDISDNPVCDKNNLIQTMIFVRKLQSKGVNVVYK